MAIKFSKTLRYRDLTRQRIQRRDKINDRRAFMVELCGGRCRVCKTTENLWFEYVGPKTEKKRYTMAQLLSRKINLIMAQKDNYKILCKKHWWAKQKKRMGKRKHGTVSMYAAGLCRCPRCRAAWNEYSKAWHRNKNRKRRVLLDAIKSGHLDFLKED